MAAGTRIVVRKGEERDLEGVVGVMRAANAEFGSILPRAFYTAYLANVLDVRSRLSESQLFVAERPEGGIVGAITLYPDASSQGWGWPTGWAGIRALAVEPSARGLGLGHRLADRCIEHARTLDTPTVCLHTAPFMDAAIRMYQSLGFRRAPEFDGDAGEMVTSPRIEPQIPALAYRLDLSSRGHA